LDSCGTIPGKIAGVLARQEFPPVPQGKPQKYPLRTSIAMGALGFEPRTKGL
jgi:hypothetical protein